MTWLFPAERTISLGDDSLCRTHKNNAVNVDYVAELELGEIVLLGKNYGTITFYLSSRRITKWYFTNNEQAFDVYESIKGEN